MEHNITTKTGKHKKVTTIGREISMYDSIIPELIQSSVKDRLGNNRRKTDIRICNILQFLNCNIEKMISRL